jgi:O-acetyl-ADP-ribose deacetylase (regulator of RNase III)
LNDLDQSEILESFLGDHVKVLVGNITTQHIDAIVTAANATLTGGGGVDGAIHKAGGPSILEACKEIRRTRFPGEMPTGEAVITTAGDLPALYVIHTVGPIKGRWGDRDAEMLANCYMNSLALAVQHNLRSIAFPSISTGAFAYPRDEAAAVSSQAIAEFMAADRQLEEIRLVFFSQADAKVFLKNHAFGQRAG